MGEIVYIQNDRVVTDSLMIAEVFGKEHRNVMADIKNQISKLNEAGEEKFSLLNFQQSDYKNDRGRTYDKYILTEEAFTLLTMSYITIEAMKFKVKYINEFNRMKSLLGNRNSKLPSSFAEALRLAADLEEEKEKLKQENLVLLPKAKIHDQIADSTNLVAVNKVAKNIGIGEHKFFEFLRATKIFFKEGSANLPMQKYQNCGYFDVKVITIENGYGGTRTQYITKVTGKGELFLLNAVNKFGGADVINNLKKDDIKEYVLNHKRKPVKV
jgi:Rha family phage regulatory protein